MTDLFGKNAVWYLMRGSGVVSLLLLTAVMALGIASWGGVQLRSLPRFATLSLHRSLSLLAVVFLAVHVVSAVVDSYAAVGLVDVFLPFGAGSQPFAVGLGAIALNLILSLMVTGALRRHIGQRTWSTIHRVAYAAWPVAFVHSLMAGSDASTLWMRVLAAASLAAIASALLWRVRVGRPGITTPSPARWN